MLARHNHKSKIKDSQLVSLKAVIPGMIVSFNYEGKKVSDKKPLIFFLHFDRKYGLIEGLNLNYLNNFSFKQLFDGLKVRTRVSTPSSDTSNLLSEDYTYIAIPPMSRMQTKSKSESKVEKQRMYEKFIGPKFGDFYRSYQPRQMRNIKIVNLKDY